MEQRVCGFCSRAFEPSRFHPTQTTCSAPECQRRRRRRNRAAKLQADADYREDCRASARKWRALHRSYWKQYRAHHPDAVARNRIQQKQRDARARLAHLANNNLAIDLTPSLRQVWWLGAAPDFLPDLANNYLAPTKVLILQNIPTTPTTCVHLANNNSLAP